MVFGERLKELIKESNIKNNQFLLDFKISRSTLTKWKNGSFLPPINKLFEISNYFQCSIDYLLCRTENFETLAPKQMPEISNQIKQVLKEQNTTIYRLLKDKVISHGVEYGLFYKQSIPTTETVVKIADYLGVSVDYLVGRI